MTDDLKHLSALTALNNMMSKSYFDLCTIDSVAELMGLTCRGTESYRILRPLHCVEWGKMPRELRDAIPGLIQQCLGIEPAYRFATTKQEVIDVSPAVKKTGFLRLLGGGK